LAALFSKALEKISLGWIQALKHGKSLDYVADGFQMGIFDLLEVETPSYQNNIHKINKHYYQQDKSKTGYFQLQKNYCVRFWL
jgi:hypothetical protein